MQRHARPDLRANIQLLEERNRQVGNRVLRCHGLSGIGVIVGVGGNAPPLLLCVEEQPMRIIIAAAHAALPLAVSAVLCGCGGASSAGLAPSASTQQSVMQLRPVGRPNSSSPSYSVRVLQSLGGTVSFAINIDDSGQASGTSFLSGDYVLHAQAWERPPRTIDLGTLGGPNSAVFQYNHGNAGQFVGWSETDATDPNDENFCGFGTAHVCLGFNWQNGKMKSLPTLGGNNDNANDVNRRGQIAGTAETGTVDSSCNAPQVFDYRAIIWQPNGRVTILQPYTGDTVSYAYTLTQSGKDVVGNSGSCAASTSHAVLWQDGSPTNLGTLGGSVNIALDINERGQIVGNSDLYGDTATHSFLWQNGTMTDLGTLTGDADSFSGGINNRGQVVGESCDASGACRGYLWQNGTMTDLNTLVTSNGYGNILFGGNINDRGEIVGAAVDSAGIERAVLLIPHRGGHASSDGAPMLRLSENVKMRLHDLRSRFFKLGKPGMPE
jgi:probable HAF family extracellular repeat protein